MARLTRSPPIATAIGWRSRKPKVADRNGLYVAAVIYLDNIYLQYHPTRQVIGSLIGLVVLIVVGVTVGVSVAKSHHSSSSSNLSHGSSPDNSNGSGASGAVNQTNPNDPSSFVLNPDLKHSFYGLAYTPAGSQLPSCGN